MNLHVLAVTSWGGACGIANFAQMLQEAIKSLGVKIFPSAPALDPAMLDPVLRALRDARAFPELIWLNYHAGLHSRWTPEQVILLKEAAPQLPIVVTYHDTYDGTSSPNSENARQLAQIVDRFIVHEPVSDIPEARLIRQGIPKPQEPFHFHSGAYPGQPMLGTAGFDFPWKNFTRLAELTAEIGWGFALAANNLTIERRREIQAINPQTLFAQDVWSTGGYRDFFSTRFLVSFLAGCHATAWMYECHNTGTSGAIRLGIAAMRPLYALRSCRQFRDLVEIDALKGNWVDTWADLRTYLTVGQIASGAVNQSSVALYATDSWDQQAKKYRQVFQEALARRSA